VAFERRGGREPRLRADRLAPLVLEAPAPARPAGITEGTAGGKLKEPVAGAA
jgi:hypothetical protein